MDIYGKARSFTGEKTFIPFRYQGQYEDVETGLYYNRFRYYSPDTGTYMSQDPIGLLGNMPNMYSYVHDSNAWIDPLGLLRVGEVAGYGSKAHAGDGLDAHEMLRNAFLKDSPLTDITTRSGAKGNPAMALDKPLHKAVHDAEARIKASIGMSRNQYFKRAKGNIRVMYQAMQEVLVDTGKISQQQLRNMRRQVEKFAKSKGCY
ncbi:RHS repeat-associated core domain-containing protein [Tenacibaculum sp. SDUM215027]|uniref:RHS repeat-associated core domain-containing protein n=1 Tax=Tenacibaculum sp. SDUM215027 TaxID=3422596 RepID=UPI003D323FE0